MRSARFALVLAIAAVAASVGAGPRKVLVLPVDGTADPAMRAKLTTIVQELSRTVPGDITNGDTTFAETASAVGCDPNKPPCVDSVLTTLAVDEVVWGTATTNDGVTTFVVKRATKGTPPHEQTAILASTEQPEEAGPRIGPLFGVTGIPPADIGSGSAGSAGSTGSAEPTGSAAPSSPPPPVVPWSQDKKLGVGLVVGGGALIIVGVALWASESGVQSDIDAAPDQSASDIQHLKDLESKAQGYAWGGNVAMVLGLGAGGYGAYLLWKDHKEHTTLTPAPAPGGGVTFVLRGSW